MKAYKSTKKIFLGLSGGVDSAVTLALLAKKHGAENIQAIFMRNWSKDLPGFQCPWQEDWHDAQSVALTLGIKIELWDFENDYKDKVVDYLISEYKAGRTPNPDIICNQEVKFKVFLEQAIQEGAAKIATGHYARITDDPISPHIKWLKIAKDKTKDQSYFLARISQKALQKTIFPLGELQKKRSANLLLNLTYQSPAKKIQLGFALSVKLELLIS
jgi:tRNA-specific 2-thiouridylase